MGSEKTHKVKKSIRWIVGLITLVLLAASYGMYNVFQPEQLPMKFIRGEVVQLTDTILLGPFPTENEIKHLKRRGVTELISLLDSSIPIESKLIEQEKRLAEKYDLVFRSVPLSYFPSSETKENVAQVEELVSYLHIDSGKKYIHCYLGRHRTSLVKKYYLKPHL